MPYRTTPLVTGSFYHVFNRGIARLPTFLDDHDYASARLGLRYYSHAEQPMRLSYLKRLPVRDQHRILEELDRSAKLVRLVAFTLMPNHFHLVVQQLVDDGIRTFIHRWLASYGHYFNTRHERVGALFQASFKAQSIYTTEQLLHVVRYVLLNPIVANLLTLEAAKSSPWTSLPEYLGASGFIDPSIILDQFPSTEEFLTFLRDQVAYGRSLEQIKHLVLE